ncbi:MAG TPA: hypothetical protein VHO06_21015, partial [Polyangia bacterium]|nr:hypothetical protein [Polyangia bacterium]
NTALHGEQVTKNVFHTEAGTVKCSTATFAGMTEEKVESEVTIEPTYGGCTAFGQSMIFHLNGCAYRLAEPTGTGPYHAAVAIECPTGAEIVIDVPSGNCSITVGPQSPTGSVKLEDEGTTTARSILATLELTGIAYAVHGPGQICGSIGPHTGASITGSVRLKGYESAPAIGQVGIWLE